MVGHIGQWEGPVVQEEIEGTLSHRQRPIGNHREDVLRACLIADETDLKTGKTEF